MPFLDIRKHKLGHFYDGCMSSFVYGGIHEIIQVCKGQSGWFDLGLLNFRGFYEETGLEAPQNFSVSAESLCKENEAMFCWLTETRPQEMVDKRNHFKKVAEVN
jgi:hypothetical protein